MTKPLEDVKVIDLSNMLMGPYTTQILGDLGADIIKVEPPGGDTVRYVGPQHSHGMGPIFLNANRSKRSIVLDLKSDKGKEALFKLLEDADILIYNRRPHVMDRLGLSYDTIKEINPGIIYMGLYGYGQGGRYAHKPAFDDLIQGAISVPWMSHMTDGRPPAYAPLAFVDRAVGLWAVGQINAALYYRAKSGEGQKIDIPMFEMMASFVLGDHLDGSVFIPPEGEVGYKRMINPDRRPYKTKDSFICVMVYTDIHWRSFFKALGKEDEMEKDPRFANVTVRTQHISEIYAELAELLLTRTTEEWLDFFDKADIPAMPLNTPEDLFKDEHLADVGFFRTFDHPTEGPIVDMAVPATWSKTQPDTTRPAPLLGQHSEEVLLEAGYEKSEISEMMAQGVTSNSKN